MRQTINCATPERTEATVLRSKPLGGIRVVDRSRFIAGPYTGHLLATLSANVVKVEAPEKNVTNRLGVVRNGHSRLHQMGGCGDAAIGSVYDSRKLAEEGARS